MEIRWLGADRLLLEGKQATVLMSSGLDDADGLPVDVDIRVLGLPTSRPAGNRPSSSGFLIDGPGEYEVQSAFIIGVQALRSPADRQPTEEDRCQVTNVDLEGLRVCHLGELGRKLTRDQVETLGEVDILALPLASLTPALAAELVAQLEPALVIPLADGADAEIPAGLTATFLEEMAADPEPAEKHLRVEAARLPEEPTVVRLRVTP